MKRIRDYLKADVIVMCHSLEEFEEMLRLVKNADYPSSIRKSDWDVYGEKYGVQGLCFFKNNVNLSYCDEGYAKSHSQYYVMLANEFIIRELYQIY